MTELPKMLPASATSGLHSVEDAFLDIVFCSVAGHTTSISSTVFRKAVGSSSFLSADLGTSARCLADIAFQKTVSQSPASRKLSRRHFPSILHALASHASRISALDAAMGLLDPETALAFSRASILRQEDYETFSNLYHSPQVQSVVSNQVQALRELVYRAHFDEACDGRAEFFNLVRDLQAKRIMPIIPNNTFETIFTESEEKRLSFRIFLKCFALGCMCKIPHFKSCTTVQLSNQLLASVNALRCYVDRNVDFSDLSASGSCSESQSSRFSAASSNSRVSVGKPDELAHRRSAASSNARRAATALLRQQRSDESKYDRGHQATAMVCHDDAGLSPIARSTRASLVDRLGHASQAEHVLCDDERASALVAGPIGLARCVVVCSSRGSSSSSSGCAGTVSVWGESSPDDVLQGNSSDSARGHDRKPGLILAAVRFVSGFVLVVLVLVGLDMFGLLDGLADHPNILDELMI
jgi:hypothetical protein